MKKLLTICLLGVALSGCTVRKHMPDRTYPSMSTGSGVVQPCGKERWTDVRCNPALSNAGGGSQ